MPGIRDRFMGVGFVGDYQGSQDTIDYYLPVVAPVAHPEKRLVPLSEDWQSLDDLREISEADRAYVNVIPDDLVEFIDVGQVVLVAGANFTDWLRISPGLKGYATSIDGYWSGLGGLYTFRFGTRAEFREITQGIWNRGLPRLYQSLFAPPDERTATLTATYFRLLSNLTGIDMRDQVLLHGTYYHQVRNPDYFELWGQTAVMHEVFPSFGEYENAILGRLRFLAEERVAESSVSRTHEVMTANIARTAWRSGADAALVRLAFNSQVQQVPSSLMDSTRLVDQILTLLAAHRASSVEGSHSVFQPTDLIDIEESSL